MTTDKKNTHSIGDHRQGHEHGHVHDEDGDHDHDHDHFDAGPDDLESNSIWIQDNITLVSVGIDIGSSGTQIVFSKVQMRRHGVDLTSRYFVVGRETLYESPVSLTPYLSEERIDEKQIGAIIDHAYACAGIHPDQIDSGAVILTGEALRRENARAIANVIAETGGEFVCAAAGHHMEAMLAAYGSGAVKASHDQRARLLNVDIGGGTTKLAIIDRGKIERTAAIHLGGRLLVVDQSDIVTRLDPAGKHLAARTGFDVSIGRAVTPEMLGKITEWMADALHAALTADPLPNEIAALYLTEPLGPLGSIDGVIFSGGVGEYVYRREDRDFGDLGRLFGFAVRAFIDAGRIPWPLLPAGECIRATALGASEYSVQLSGNTVYVSNPRELLPRRNLQVLQPGYRVRDEIDSAALAAAITAHFEAFDLIEGEADVALAFRWSGAPSYPRLAAFARGIVDGLRHSIERKRPIIVVLDGDVAQTLGALLKEELKIASEVMVIDGISLWDFDYIDLGRIRLPSNTIPVTIKSLVFSEDPRMPHAHPHLHAHS